MCPHAACIRFDQRRWLTLRPGGQGCSRLGHHPGRRPPTDDRNSDGNEQYRAALDTTGELLLPTSCGRNKDLPASVNPRPASPRPVDNYDNYSASRGFIATTLPSTPPFRSSTPVAWNAVAAEIKHPNRYGDSRSQQTPVLRLWIENRVYRASFERLLHLR